MAGERAEADPADLEEFPGFPSRFLTEDVDRKISV
jgi:hypothetical protein